MSPLHTLNRFLIAFAMVVPGLACGKGNALPPPEQLATIDAGADIPPAELVEEFRITLDRLSKKCPSQRQDEIKDEIIQGQKILQRLPVRGGGNLRLIEIAQLMDKTIPDGSVVEKCDKLNTSLIR